MFDLPPRLIVFIVAMLPLSELRGAIPLAIAEYGMTTAEAYLLGVLGNLVPVVFLLYFLGPIEQRLRFIKVFDRFFENLFHRTRRKHSERIDRYGALGLVTFVAIPLPVTGAWTGCAAAYVFGIQKRYSFPAIVLGVVIAGLIVTSLTHGVVNGVLN
ncbi:putative small multi-drug export protein [archaeon BMS3Abin16]|nr:putative small multi-drug export protein [archaeon BMS3Abin16]HDY74472.1 ligand-binding protein SH3 [Euryarchaeota archaeon]